MNSGNHTCKFIGSAVGALITLFAILLLKIAYLFYFFGVYFFTTGIHTSYFAFCGSGFK